jgi:hypothetical protein
LNAAVRTGSWLVIQYLLLSGGQANPPANITPDPGLQAWFRALKHPSTQLPCCSISNCRFSPYTVQDDHYGIKIDGWTYVVPDASVIRNVVNPFRSAVVCYSNEGIGVPEPPFQDTLRIFCFLPPGATS